MIDREKVIKGLECILNEFVIDNCDDLVIRDAIALLREQEPVSEDMVSRKAVLALAKDIVVPTAEDGQYRYRCIDPDAVRELPSAQPTLYGYKIEHLIYIAKVMEKEGVTAEYAVRTFDDISRIVRMLIEEAQRKVEEMLNG